MLVYYSSYLVQLETTRCLLYLKQDPGSDLSSILYLIRSLDVTPVLGQSPHYDFFSVLFFDLLRSLVVTPVLIQVESDVEQIFISLAQCIVFSFLLGVGQYVES